MEYFIIKSWNIYYKSVVACGFVDCARRYTEQVWKAVSSG